MDTWREPKSFLILSNIFWVCESDARKDLILAEGLKEIPELQVIGKPNMSIVAFGSVTPEINIFAVADYLEDHKVYNNNNRYSFPSGLEDGKATKPRLHALDCNVATFWEERSFDRGFERR
jgi:hypothetical protein